MKLINHENVYLEFEEKRKNQSIKNEIRDRKKIIKQENKSLNWLKSINRRFRVLENFYINSPIYVHEWHDFSQGNLSYLDIQIKLPFRLKDIWCWLNHSINYSREFGWKNFLKILWQDRPKSFDFRWIFTVNSRKIFFEKSHEEIHSELLWHCKCLKNDKSFILENREPISFFKWFDKNINRLIEKYGPIITFDEIQTSQESFTKDDVVKYTRIWLQKWYPKLAKRKIIFCENNNA